MKQQKSFYPKEADIKHSWVLIDASGQTLGRIASFVASVVRGKNKPIYTPSVDVGDNVVVINSDQVVVTGNKATQKKYHRHSGYPGGLKTQIYKDAFATNSTRVVETAIRGMLPKTKLGSKLIQKVKIYRGAEHPHAAQAPVALEIKAKEI